MTRLPARRDLDAVLLDAGGVLVNPDWDRIASVLAAHDVVAEGPVLAQAEPRAKKILDRHEQMESTTDESRAASFFGLVLREAGYPAAVPPRVWAELKAAHQKSNLWRVVLPGVQEALARLRESGLRLAVVSNANGTVKELFGDLGLASFFDVLVDSFVEGVEKPDPEIFRRALARVGASAHRALHVGDFYHLDVVGARAAGVAPALIDAGGLYDDCDCPRFASLPELVDALLETR